MIIITLHTCMDLDASWLDIKIPTRSTFPAICNIHDLPLSGCLSTAWGLHALPLSGCLSTAWGLHDLPLSGCLSTAWGLHDLPLSGCLSTAWGIQLLLQTKDISCSNCCYGILKASVQCILFADITYNKIMIFLINCMFTNTALPREFTK